jgi:DNA-directed RNA polymerase specialized sigma24 family protein
LLDCVRKLSEAGRRLLRAFYLDSRKVKDIAAELGQTIAATYQSLSRLRRSLSDCVEEQEREEDR